LTWCILAFFFYAVKNIAHTRLSLCIGFSFQHYFLKVDCLKQFWTTICKNNNNTTGNNFLLCTILPLHSPQ
jgi:hypothetical protein